MKETYQSFDNKKYILLDLFEESCVEGFRKEVLFQDLETNKTWTLSADIFFENFKLIKKNL
jgi:hypothetical protein